MVGECFAFRSVAPSINKFGEETEMKARKEKEVVFGPQPPPKFLTTRGLIVRGIIFFAAIAGAIYLIWQEFSGK